jgi:protein arginine kinase
MFDLSTVDKFCNYERHNISKCFLLANNSRGFLINCDESVCVMINEEDHIRIQSICSGSNIDIALKLANNVDDLISSGIDYAFNKRFGYCTSCPTNVGTGLRASYMLHLPMVDKNSKLKLLTQLVNKFGITIRGLHGEGTEALGSIYQISNQITLGKSEEDIINNLYSVTKQIVEQEMKMRNKIVDELKLETEDQLMRSYGILTNCKKLNVSEAMKLLSDVWLGYSLGFAMPKFKSNIYKIMINIQDGCIQKISGKELNQLEMDIERAKYIKTQVVIKNDV